MNWRPWRWFRTEDLAVSQNIEDRRGDKPRTYWQILMALWSEPKIEVDERDSYQRERDAKSKLAQDLGINDVD